MGLLTRCWLLWVTSIMAAHSATVTPEQQLRQLEIRIQELQVQRQDTQTQYGQLQRQLQHSEEDIGQVARNLEVLHGALSDKQNTLADLKQQQTDSQTQLEAQREVLTQQIRAAYIMGRQDYLKLWLNQQDPFTIGRVLTYYDYFNRARTVQINKINAILKQLTQLKTMIQQESVELNQLVQEHTQKKEQLELTYNERQKILTQLAQTLEDQDKELKRLQEDKRHLEALLGTLDNELQKIPQPKGLQKPFAQLKGKLPYPIRGKVIKRFGERLIGRLKWQGILIKAPMGKKVHVVATGRVVFAQWFRHYGLLVIIDHGEGYMSLYAHNQSLYIKQGDQVATNAVIATVGKSGGQQISGLYFEIRHQGIPQPPKLWLR